MFDAERKLRKIARRGQISVAKKEEASSGSHKQRKTMPMQPPGYPMGEHISKKDAECHCGKCSTVWPLPTRNA